MDVQCERCKTEYEFDDALVSGRGTTVKCTNCGFQFKIKPPDPGAAAERWVVRSLEGKELVFTTLRELQRAITNRQVGRSDTLSRGSAPPRPLASIAELEPFFLSSDRPPPPGASVQTGSVAQRTPGPPGAPKGGGPSGAAAISRDGQNASTAASFPRRPASANFDAQGAHGSPTAVSPLAQSVGAAAPGQAGVAREVSVAARAPSPPPFNRQISRPPSDDLPPVRPRMNTLRPSVDQPGAVPPPMPASGPDVQAAASLDSGFAHAGTVVAQVPPRFGAAQAGERASGLAQAPGGAPALGQPIVSVSAPPPRTAQGFPAPAPPPQTGFGAPNQTAVMEPSFSSPLPPPTVPVRRTSDISFDDAEMADQMRFPQSLSDSDDLYSIAPRRRRVGGWIVAFVLLGGVMVIGYKVGQPYFAGLSAKSGALPPLDPRAQQFVDAGEKALADGDLDSAKEKLDKASALAENDPRVQLDLARLASARADVPWLKLRLLPADATDDIKATKQNLDDLAAVARKAADAALASAPPDDVAALRAKVDALRIIGERDAARSYVAKIIGNASQPETAYVLAALDLAELDPLWTTVIDRLRVAAAGEGNAGRARAALVYALARAGDAAGAKAELDRLAALTRPHPLIAPLRAFLGKTPATRPPDAGVAGVDASASPQGPQPAQPAAAVDVNSLPRPSAGDPREILKQAAAAENRRDFTLANKLYEDMLRADPRSSEALGGLGSVALKQRDLTGAKSYFKRALGNNPSYLSALVGLADIQWEEGDHAGAAKKYKDIIDRFPAGSGYPSWVKTRAEEGTGSAPVPSSTGSGTLTLPPNTPSDLPGNP
jgi:predicted Zn finger-like uncharacterized protein